MPELALDCEKSYSWCGKQKEAIISFSIFEYFVSMVGIMKQWKQNQDCPSYERLTPKPFIIHVILILLAQKSSLNYISQLFGHSYKLKLIAGEQVASFDREIKLFFHKQTGNVRQIPWKSIWLSVTK